MSPKRLLISAPDAARLLSISRTEFCELHDTEQLGPLPVAFGRRPLWRVDELKFWVESGCPPRWRWLQRDADVDSRKEPIGFLTESRDTSRGKPSKKGRSTPKT